MQENRHEESYYARYRRTAYRFGITGGVVFSAAVLINEMTGRRFQTALLSVAALGGMLLLFGVINMRPNNRIKAFAVQLRNTPDRDFAQGLLDAITSSRRTGLSRRSATTVDEAIIMYAATQDADPELVDALKKAREKHIANVMF